jgi:hypothetical protein
MSVRGAARLCIGLRMTAKPFIASFGQPEKLVTDREFAAQASISRRFVHTLRARGQLRAVKLGGALRFPLYENLAHLLSSTGDESPSGKAA